MRKAFISYSHKDKQIANIIKNKIPKEIDVWIDDEKIKPGDLISDKIRDGISSADYYILLISDESNKSAWVKREISYAIELADKTKLALIPIIIGDTEVPFEFQGLLYIDFRESIEIGIDSLIRFFEHENSTAAQQENRIIIRKSFDSKRTDITGCILFLQNLKLCEIRMRMVDGLSINSVKEIWFDLFERKMEDEITVSNVSMASIEIIDRSRRERKLSELYDVICKNYSYIMAN